MRYAAAHSPPPPSAQKEATGKSSFMPNFSSLMLRAYSPQYSHSQIGANAIRAPGRPLSTAETRALGGKSRLISSNIPPILPPHSPPVSDLNANSDAIGRKMKNPPAELQRLQAGWRVKNLSVVEEEEE